MPCGPGKRRLMPDPRLAPTIGDLGRRETFQCPVGELEQRRLEKAEIPDVHVADDELVRKLTAGAQCVCEAVNTFPRECRAPS